jgi:glycosyltransferase involved in cell wall biosynthesis
MSSMNASNSTPSNDRRIWYLIPALSIGGTERTLVDLVNNIDHDRYDVTVWTIFDQNPLAAEVSDRVRLRSLGVRGVTPSDREEYVERARNPLEYVLAPLRFVRAVRAESPPVLQAFLPYDNFIACLAGAASPDTTIITGVRAVPDDRTPFRRALDRTAFALTDRIVPNSAAGAEFAIGSGASSGKVEVIRNGRKLDRYDTPSSKALRDELGISGDGPIVGTIGRLIDRKGHQDLLSAWPGIRQRHPDSRLLVVGDGPEREPLVEYAATLGCGDSVQFLGFREDVPELLDCLDLFVFPSHYEGLPGSLLEAMAAGVPIVATAIGGNAELVASGKTGLLVPRRDPRGIEHAVDALLQDRDFAARVGSNAREDAHDRFTLETMVENFERFYEELL